MAIEQYIPVPCRMRERTLQIFGVKSPGRLGLTEEEEDPIHVNMVRCYARSKHALAQGFRI